MKSKKLLDIIRGKDLVVPNILLVNYKELKIDCKELLFVSLLMSYDDVIYFDPEHFSRVLGFEIKDIMEIMSSLSSKKYVNLVVKNNDGKIKEFLDISYLYERLASLVVSDAMSDDEESGSEIYTVIETELGRTLSPIEYETISGWLSANIGEDLIKEALKEAVLNGVGNLKYIDKILYDWTKKGYKKASDVKRKKRSIDENVELFEYDWLDEND